MAEYALVRDRDGNVTGLWLVNEAMVKPQVMIMLLLKGGLTESQIKALPSTYRVVPNKVDSKGGCFVMYGAACAPGEPGYGSPKERTQRARNAGAITLRDHLLLLCFGSVLVALVLLVDDTDPNLWVVFLGVVTINALVWLLRYFRRPRGSAERGRGEAAMKAPLAQEISCPKCGGSFKMFRLGGRHVHKCVSCGHKDY